jgi:hypothetical protein
MGRLVHSKKKTIDLGTEQPKKKLYRPISEFKWKDASEKEIKSEAILHYSKIYQL